MTSTVARLRAQGFFRLWTAETSSLVGSQVSLFALPLVAITQLDASAFEVGLLAAFTSAATLLVGLSAGAIADHFERIRLMQVCNVIRIGLVGSVAVLAFMDALTFGFLLVIGFSVASLSLVYDSARAAVVPHLVRRDDLPAANSWVQGSVAAADVAGPGLAGVLVQTLSASTAMLVDAVSYLIGALALRRVPRVHPSPEAKAQRHLPAIADGLRFLRRDSVQLRLAVAAGHYNVFHAMFFAVFTLFALQTLGLSVLELGLVGVATGLAGMLGVFVAAPVSRVLGLGSTMVAVYALPGLAALLVPLCEGAPRWLMLVTVIGSQSLWTVLVVVNLVISESVKQVRTPGHMLGRVSSATRFVSAAADPVGALMGGVLASSVLGPRGTLIVASAGLVTSVVWPLATQVRGLRTLGDAQTVTVDMVSTDDQVTDPEGGLSQPVEPPRGRG